MEKKKICIVSEYAYSSIKDIGKGGGGAELQMVLLAKELVKKGFEVHFICFDNSNRNHEIVDGINVYSPYEIKNKGIKHFHPLNLFGFYNLFSKINPDIILQSAGSPVVGIISLFKAIKKKKFIFISSSDPNVNETLEIRNLHDLIKLPYKYGVKKADCVICQSKHQKDNLNERIGKTGVIIKTIIPIEDSENENQKKNILWVGRLIKSKRPELYLELAKKLPQYSFKMIGPPSNDMKYYKKIKRNSEMITNLKFKEFVPHNQIGKEYSKSFVLISTSKSEGFPNIFLEAWNSSLPIISLDIDPDNLIKNYQLGLYATNFDDLVKNTIELMENPKLRAKMGENSLKYVKENHNSEKIVEQYINLFDKLYKK